MGNLTVHVENVGSGGDNDLQKGTKYKVTLEDEDGDTASGEAVNIEEVAFNNNLLHMYNFFTLFFPLEKVNNKVWH